MAGNTTNIETLVVDVNPTEDLLQGDGEANATLASHDLVLQIINIIIGTLGLIGNGFVILVIFNHKKMLQQVTNIYIVNQSFIDATAALMLILDYSLTNLYKMKLEGIGGELLCRLWLTTGPLWGMLASSSANLVAVTIERYAAVIHPIWHKNSFTRRKAFYTLPFVWMAGPLVNGIYSVPPTRVQDGACLVFWFWPNDAVRRLMGFFVVIFKFLIPILIFAICYGRMAYQLQKKAPAKSGNEQTADKKRQQPDYRTKAFMNILKTLVVVVACFIGCWGPNQIYFLLFNLGLDYPYINFGSIAYHFTVVLTFTNCCINPFIYAAKYKQFQTGIKKLFRIQENEVHSSTGTSIVT